MEKPICTMAWEIEVTFYRETEGTENLVSYLPSKIESDLPIQSVLHASITSPNSIFVKGEDYFLSHVP